MSNNKNNKDKRDKDRIILIEASKNEKVRKPAKNPDCFELIEGWEDMEMIEF